MNYPNDRKYAKTDEWVKEEGNGIVSIGLTFYAQDSLGDIVFVEMEDVGSNLEQEDSFGEVESVKAASDLIMPVSGEIVEINDDLEQTPELINENPNEEWLVKVKLSNPAELEDLLSAEDYEDYLKDR